ncbi:MAG: hypothetical protein ACRCTZ_16115 [Sarcina sp.]
MFIKIGNKAYPYEEIKSLKVECGGVDFANTFGDIQKNQYYGLGLGDTYLYYTTIGFKTTIDVFIELKNKIEIEFISVPYDGFKEIKLKSKDNIEESFNEIKHILIEEIEEHISDNFVKILRLNDNFLAKRGEKHENNR